MVQILNDLPVDKLYALADALKTAIDALSDRIASSRMRAENVADAQRIVDWQNLLFLIEFYIQRKDKSYARDFGSTGTATTTYEGDYEYD